MMDHGDIRVVAVHGPRDVRLDTVDFPQSGDHDVLVRMRACGVCGTDVHYIKAGGSPRFAGPGAMPIGHEGAGEIVSVGAAVETFHPGQRVIINPMAASAVIGSGGAEGALSDVLLVRDAGRTSALLPIPQTMSFEDAALAEPLAVALRTVNRAQPRPGETAVVYGAGPIGLGIVLWLKRRGVRHVLAIDLSPERLDLALAMGADDVINARTDPGVIERRIVALHGEAEVLGMPVSATDMYFDAAGVPSVIQSAITLGKNDSRLVIVAMHGAPVPIDLLHFMSKEMRITGSVGYREELAEVLTALATIGDLARRMVTDTYRFDDVIAGLNRAAESDSGKVMITFAETA